MTRFRVDDDTEYIELNEWQRELTFFHELLKVSRAASGYKLLSMGTLIVRRPSCLELTARTFATNHFKRTFQALSKNFLFGQILRSAH